MQATLNEKAYEYIRGALLRGELKPGNRLVTRTLAAEIGVSLGPVREALHRLSSEGLVKHVPGGGAFVRQFDVRELEELYILRDATESCAAGEAAKYISEHQLLCLENILREWREIAKKISTNSKDHATKSQLNRWLDLEQEFHEVLIEASRNRILAKVIDDHRAISNVFAAQRGDPAILTSEVVEWTCDNRSAFIKALHERDSERCRQLMSLQIQQGMRTVLAFMRDQMRKG